MLVHPGSSFINGTPDHVQVRQRAIVRLCSDRDFTWFTDIGLGPISASADCLQLAKRDTQPLAPEIDLGLLAVYGQQVSLETQSADGDTRSDGWWYEFSGWAIRGW